MKYIVVSCKGSSRYETKLIEQLEQRDFRAEILRLSRRDSSAFFQIHNIKRKLKTFEPDIVIDFESTKSGKKLLSFAQSIGIKTCIYYPFNQSEAKYVGTKANLNLLTRPTGKSMRPPHENYFYIGNPLYDLVKDYEFNSQFSLDENVTNVAVQLDLQGLSKETLMLITKIVEQLDSFRFHISIEGDEEHQIVRKLSKSGNVSISTGSSYDLLKHCNASITTYGVASLEAAFLNCPQIVVSSKGGGFLRKIRQVSLVKEFAGREIVKELNTVDQILDELNLILNDQQYCANMLAEYQILKDKIGHDRASKKAAQIIVDFLESGSP